MMTVTEVLDLLGVEVDSNHKFTLRDERTPSVHDFGDHWWDFGAGKGGDVIDLVRELCRGENGEMMPYNKALTMLMHKALKAGREPGDVERQAPRELVDFSEQWNRAETGWVHEWEGIYVHAFGLATSDSGILVPHRRDGRIYGVKVRGHDGSKTSWPGSQFTYSLYHPYGWNSIDLDLEVAIITEGESDCWVVEAAVQPEGTFVPDVFALPSGAGSWKDSWLKDLEPYSRVIVIMDNDPAGQKARQKLESKIGHLRVKHLYVPQLANDVREAVTKLNWPVAQAIADAMR